MEGREEGRKEGKSSVKGEKKGLGELGRKLRERTWLAGQKL